MKMKIILGVGVLVLLLAAVGGTLFFTGALSKSDSNTAMNTPALAAAVPNLPVFYHHIQPEFVVNFNRKERPRALMIEISVASHSEEALELLDSHTPELRNDLLLYMTENNGTSLFTANGKNALRDGVKVTLNELLKKHGYVEAVEDIFFTRFVLQ